MVKVNKNLMRLKILTVIVICFFTTNVFSAQDDSDSLTSPREIYDLLGARSFVVSIKDLMGQFKRDIPSIVGKTDKTVITSYTQSENLTEGFKNYIFINICRM